MTVHELKCWPGFFLDLQRGDKTFEVRKNDRDYRVHDSLRLREWYPSTSQYSGATIELDVTYVADLTPVGCPGMVGMGVRRIR